MGRASGSHPDHVGPASVPAPNINAIVSTVLERSPARSDCPRAFEVKRVIGSSLAVFLPCDTF